MEKKERKFFIIFFVCLFRRIEYIIIGLIAHRLSQFCRQSLMRSGASGHADEVVVKSIEMVGGAGLLFDVRLVMVRR